MLGNGKTQDGIWLVPTIDLLRVLPCADLDDGTPCWVIASRSRFNLAKNDGRPDDNASVIAPLVGSPSAGNASARWVLVVESAPVPGASNVGDELTAASSGQVGFTLGQDPFYSLVSYEDFLSLAFPWGPVTTGGGTTSVTSTTVWSQTHQGIVELIVAPVGSGASVRLFSGSIMLLPDNFSFQYMVNVSLLSTPAQRYKIRVGFSNQLAPLNANPTNGLWVEYDESTSPNWLLCAVSVIGGGVVVSVDTGIPVTTGWHLLELRRALAGAPIVVIDGVTGVSVPSSSLPRSTEFLSPAVGAVKTIGATSISTYLDYIYVVMAFPTGRTLP